MSKVEELRTAKAKFREQYPNAAVGIGSDYSLQVRVENESEVADLPKEFEGFPVFIRVTGKIVSQD